MPVFLAPWFLIGMISAGIPLLIHLSRSRRQNRMRFSTTRFFTEQFLRSYRMSRLKELLLLILRMALCALFALALAKPLLRVRGTPLLAQGSRAVVLVIDDSASMTCLDRGQSLLDRAKMAARQVVQSLGPGDSASIVLAGRRGSGPAVLFDQPTTEHGDLLQAIDNIEPQALGTDLPAAVAKAEQIVKLTGTRSMEVYVLSDLQDSGWTIDDQRFARGGESDVMFFFVSIRPREPQDLAITSVQYGTSRPMVGVPFLFRAFVHNQSDKSRPAEVSLHVDGQKVGQRKIEELAPGRWAVVRFYHSFDAGGWHSGAVEVDDADLPADNKRFFAFQVVDRVKVLAVNGSPSAVRHLDELFFLRAALTLGGEATSPIQFDEITPGQLAGRLGSDYRMVVLANVESLPPGDLEKLEQFVDQGGSLLVFLGDRVNGRFYNDTLNGPARLHGGLLPAQLVSIEGDPAAQQPLTGVGFIDVSHPALAGLDEVGAPSLTGVKFRQLWSLKAPDSSVLMRSDAGWPLLCEKQFGRGRTMLFASSADRDWSDLPVRPVFLPWVYRLVGYLAQQPLGREGFFETGQSIPLPTSAREGLPQLLVRKPDGSISHPAAQTTPGGGLQFSDTPQIGIYKVFSADDDREAQAQLFVANLDPYESDLRYLDDVLAAGSNSGSLAGRIESGFRQLMPDRPMVAYVSDESRINEASLAARRGIKLWDLALLAVLAIALFEPWLANRISKRLYVQAAAAGGVATGRATRTTRRVGPASTTENAA